MTFKIHRSNDKDQPWFFTLVADNGKTVAVSETYHNLQDALNTITAIRNGAAKADLTVNNEKIVDAPAPFTHLNV